MKKTLTLMAMAILGSAFAQTNVTFQVDMNNFTGTFTAPEVNGTFNSWCGNCAAMTDADSNNVWEVTIALTAGDTVEYKYSHDAWTGQETNDPTAACTNGNATYTNRVLVVPAASDTLDVVCWASCDACSGVSLDEEAAIMTLSPNPANEGLNVDFAGTQGNYAIMTLNGQVVASGTLVHGQNDVTTAALPNGVYIVRVASEQGQTMQKLAIRH